MSEELLREILQVVRGLESRLGALEAKVEARLYDTRPMMEVIVAKLIGLEERMDRLETSFEQFREETREQLAHVNHQLEILTLDVMDVRAKQRSLDKRVSSLENPSVS